MASNDNQLTWLITGSSAGLGKILAARALEAGHKVIGTCRSRKKSRAALEPLMGKGLEVIELDTSAQQVEIEANVKKALSIYGKIDILVNNAGYAALGPLERFTDEEVLKQLRTNTLGPLHVAQAVLPNMRSRKSGMIVNVSSYVGMRGDAANGVYAISKFGLEAWSESLSKEVAEFGISVLVAEFGAFRTGFLNTNAFVRAPKDVISGYEGSTAEKAYAGILQADEKQPGDPEKGVDHLFQVIMAGGFLGGRKIFRLPIGADAVEIIGDKVQSVQRDLQVAKVLEESDSTAL
ncbi:short-chain dehydrogenases/reductase, putative [Talaromyces stipitatus ATCC 10500]|uniref:Short-chain dehydrogenases/reductase, putative n=1 Tax=Talaromyces stipitatus (strain ATCC 10500 / CBS 375.48 / QM 6759 / NRRL 1006) TaxID=441959 RepID=B8MIQ8_TALSN|nr:short-chain dehydrogenases/reductase, putative [Talaromyces stipitatus ATCC 10500]EED15570.1 short-chain dehydrogenases/reductase, putative [Talaromyces stipitatus ATCC 10500]